MVAPRHKIILDPKGKFATSGGDLVWKGKGPPVAATPVTWAKLCDQGANPTGNPRYSPSGADIDGPPSPKRQVRIETVRMAAPQGDGETVWVAATYTDSDAPDFIDRREVWVGATAAEWEVIAAAYLAAINGD